jgi:acyl phosphate:glycerol-3-phosphate acyltransferase
MIYKMILPIITAYILGAIPFSYLLGKMLKGVDIRKVGSCNVGATNLMRNAGRPIGIAALILDILKGVIAVTIIADMFYSSSMAVNLYMFKVILGISVVSGHMWTVFLRFKGGKGVATTIGVLTGISPIAILLGLLVWLLFALFFRYVSLASVAMALSLPVLMFFLKQPEEYIVLSLVLCGFIIYKHRSNLVRIVKGMEYKIGNQVK